MINYKAYYIKATSNPTHLQPQIAKEFGILEKNIKIAMIKGFAELHLEQERQRLIGFFK
jgi:hypothetical protein